MLQAEPADRPSMAEVRDELAKLAAGRSRDTTTVLLARTDLGSGQSRNRTAEFPAGGLAAGAVAGGALADGNAGDGAVAGGLAADADAPAPPAPAAPDRTRPPARTPGRRRGRALWLLVGLVALVLAGLIAFLVTRPGDGDPSPEATSPTTSAPSAEPPESAAEETATEESTPAETTAPETTEPATAQDPGQAVSGFFAFVPGDLRAAYELTSPAFQSEFSYERFSGFWDDYESVSIGNVETESDTSALVDITYVERGGAATTERHRITFVRDGDRLLLERDVIA